MVADPDRGGAGSSRIFDRVQPGLGARPVYLHALLITLTDYLE